MHRLRHLRSRVSHARGSPGQRCRRHASRRPPGPHHAARRARPGLATPRRRDARVAQAGPRFAVGRSLPVADERAPAGLAGLAVDGDRLPPGSHCPVPGSLPRRNGRRAVCRAHRPGPLRRGLPGCGRSQSIPLGLRVDLHGAVRVGLPAGHSRRADRHPTPEALCDRKGQAPGGRRAEEQAQGEGRDRRRRTRRHVGCVLPGPARLQRDGDGSNARSGRHDGDRHPRISPAARCPARGDRSHRRPRR